MKVKLIFTMLGIIFLTSCTNEEPKKAKQALFRKESDYLLQRNQIFNHERKYLSFKGDLNIRINIDFKNKSLLSNELLIKSISAQIIPQDSEFYGCENVSKNDDDTRFIVNCKRSKNKIKVMQDVITFFIEKVNHDHFIKKVRLIWHNYPFSTNKFKDRKDATNALTSDGYSHIENIDKIYSPNKSSKKIEPLWIAIAKKGERRVLVHINKDFQVKTVHGKQQVCSHEGIPLIDVITPEALDTRSVSNHMKSPLSGNFTGNPPLPWSGAYFQSCRIPGLKVQDACNDAICGTLPEFSYSLGNEVVYTSLSEPLAPDYGKLSISSEHPCFDRDCNKMGFAYTTETTYAKGIAGHPFYVCPNHPNSPSIIDPVPISCSQTFPVPTFFSNQCSCTHKLPNGGCDPDFLYRRALYHIQRFMLSVNSVLGISTSSPKITLTVDKLDGLCGEATFYPVTRDIDIKLSNSSTCGNKEKLLGGFAYTTYHEAYHALSFILDTGHGNYQFNYPYNEFTASEEARAIYIGGSFTRFSGAAPVPTSLGKSSGNLVRSLYPTDFNNCSKCITSACSNCTGQSFSDIWVNTFIALEKMIGQRNALRLVIHHPILTDYNANFVHPRDLKPECALTPPQTENGFTDSVSHYEAMIQTDDWLFQGKHRIEIWRAFQQNLVAQNCLKKYDDIGNSRSAAKYIDIRGGQTSNSHNNSGFASINHEHDEDWYYIYVPQEKTVNIILDPIGGLELEVFIKDLNGNTLLHNINPSVLSFQAPNQDGFYFIQVKRLPNSNGPLIGDYNIQVQSLNDRESDIIGPESEPVPISLNNTIVSPTIGTINTTNDIDTFRFWVNQNQYVPLNFELSLSSSDPNYSLHIELLRGDGTVMTNTTLNGTGGSLLEGFNGGEWYYIRLSSPNQTTGDYSLKITASQVSHVRMEDAKGAFVLNGTTSSDAIPDTLYHYPSFLLESSGVNSRVSATMTDLSPRFYKLFLQRNEQVLLSIDTLRASGSIPSQPAIKVRLYERTSTQLDPSGKEIQSRYSLRMLRKIGIERSYETSVPQMDRDAGYIEIEEEGKDRHRLQFATLKTGWYLMEITPKDINSLGAYKISVAKTSNAQQVLQHVCQ
jgi:hypothetical protein